ncbi:response regulator transcription factor [Pseudanabaena sp. ABRG5-3]|uniref:response regulator transcription factor n=1 Tax=Pseudanabaena sp. ABRG5-3 TaxID=685565 RepID=UPI0013A5FC19|nr:helix-turn-helix transcriptional regulator [Pseudanabaena sp. ABRG5-3]
MTRLSNSDYQNVLAFLHDLYIPDNLRNFPTYVLEEISKLIPSEIPLYTSSNYSNFEVHIMAGEPPNVPNAEVHIKQHFCEHPFVSQHIEKSDFSACKLSDFLSEAELHKSEVIYQNFLRFMDIEDTMLLALPQTFDTAFSINEDQFAKTIRIEGIQLCRSQRTFTERDRIILNCLQPHLIRAQQTAHNLSRKEKEHQQLQHSLNRFGGIAISKDGYVQLMTPKAEQLLWQYFSFKYLGKFLPEHLQRWVSYQKSLFSKEGTLSKLRVPLIIEKDGKQLNVRFLYDLAQDQYLLLLEEQQQPKLSIEDLELLGLSKREAEVLYWVAQGKENPDIAKTLHVGVATIRKHLENIYHKLGVNTRATAVVEALKRLGILH